VLTIFLVPQVSVKFEISP